MLRRVGNALSDLIGGVLIDFDRCAAEVAFRQDVLTAFRDLRFDSRGNEWNVKGLLVDSRVNESSRPPTE